ncbi:unnamed protein product [Malus baccata var. baccata]
MIPNEKQREQSDEIQDVRHANSCGSRNKELKRRVRVVEWKRKKKMKSIVISFQIESIWDSLILGFQLADVIRAGPWLCQFWAGLETSLD